MKGATGAFNQRVQDDRFYPQAKHVAAGIRWWLYFPVKYLTDGIDNHAFDTNSPELIQQAIDDGRIKPFERVKTPED
jgi:hypothetical protein